MQLSFIDHKKAIMHKKTVMSDLYDLLEEHLRNGSATLQNTANYMETPWKTREEIRIGIRNQIYSRGEIQNFDLPLLHQVEKLLYLEEGYFSKDIEITT
jgi:hypothetical protein